MDLGFQNQEKVPEHLRKLLAVAVRNIQWSYSIFWSISSSEPGVLEWGEGYYNGDIKTRKTVQAVEMDVDQMGLQRSEQLRELYESLLAGESSPQARRPSAALSPEDLSNTEWYYLVCMSFVFNLGEGLPGRTFENGQLFWLCNAHQGDSRVFSRSLLAKSASVQTVVCFPFLGGVVELGVTDLVSEDLSLIQLFQASLLGIDCPALLQSPSSLIHQDNDEILDTALTPFVSVEDLKLFDSPDDSSNGLGLFQPVEETEFIMEGGNGDLIDDDLSNGVHTSLTTSDCISHSLINPAENRDKIYHQGQDNSGGSYLVTMESDAQHLWSDDVHYQNVLAALLKNTNKLTLEPYVGNNNTESCFASWRKGGVVSYHSPRNECAQRILKKVLFEVPRMHDDSSIELKVDSARKDELWKPEVDELASSHVLAERRRERVNDRFLALKSLIPSIDKVDKVSILDDTIKHLSELERRVEELEACRDLDKCNEGRRRTMPQDMAERTSDNYGIRKAGVKRKASDTDSEEKLENSLVSLRDCSTYTNLSISLIQKDVLIEITCPWKECLLLEIIDVLNNLRLDTHMVQSSTSNSFLSLTINAKSKGPGRISAGMIRQVLQRVLLKSG